MVGLRQFDVFRNPSTRTRAARPFFIVLQSDQISLFDTRIVAPLVAPMKIAWFERLMPEVTIAKKRYVIFTPELGPMPIHALQPPVANLESERYRIISALDLVFTGI